MKNKSAIWYRRLRNVRGRLRCPADLPFTALPRYGMNTKLSHRRGQTRMEKWLQYV